MEPNKRANYQSKKIKILFVDNDADFLSTRVEFLERAGYWIVKATSLAEAEKLLCEEWASLVILDVRLEDDDDEKDISGFLLAKQELHKDVHKIILTNFPSHIHEALDGISPIVDFLGKQDGPDALINAIVKALSNRVHINWTLAIDWKTREPFGLVNLIEPGLECERIPNRAEEFEDLFRRLFYEKDHIRVERLLWQREGCLALIVFAFKEGMKPESFVVVCGQNAIVRNEAQRFDEYSPKAAGDSGTVLGDKMRAETTHFAANAYMLANNDLENIQTLFELYRFGPEKAFNAALNNLYQQTLKAWHQEKPVRQKGTILDGLYQGRLHLTDLAQQYFEERIDAIEAQCPTIGVRIERSEGRLSVHFSNQSFTHSDPTLLLAQTIGREQPALMITVPGMLSGDNILTDESGHAWVTDFAAAGLAPHFWNFVTLEATIRFDWENTRDLQRWHELEHSLIFTDFAKPDIRDLEPIVRKPARAIQVIRKLAARTVGRDIMDYHLGIFFHAARRLADFNPAYPLKLNELARLGHILLSIAMIAGKLEQDRTTEDATAFPLPAEISIVDEKARIVMVGNRRERLAPQPFEVLRYLNDHANQVCTKEELLGFALKGKYDESYLHTIVGRIRRIIEDDPGQPRFLITEPGAGYRLILKPN